MTSAFHEAFSIFVFLVTIVGTYGLSTKGIRLRIPYLSWTFSLGSETVPWLSVLVLLAFRALHFKELGRALIGEQGLRPYAIAIQLVSVAYISVTCEATGVYAWAALHVAKRTVGRPQLLLACFFLLSSLVSALTCAEVALVTLTPIMVYSAGAANMEPMALMCVHLAAASLGGMLLPVASGINIVTSQAFHLSLLRFCGWMLAPTLASAAVVFGLLLLQQRRQEGKQRRDRLRRVQQQQPDSQRHAVPVSPRGAQPTGALSGAAGASAAGSAGDFAGGLPSVTLDKGPSWEAGADGEAEGEAARLLGARPRPPPAPEQAPCPDPGLVLHDQVGASFGSAALVGCVLLMAAAPALRWSPWAVALVFAAFCALYNFAALSGPQQLRGSIGRRGAYERRRKLREEMVKHGIYRTLSDEDLADLVLSYKPGGSGGGDPAAADQPGGGAGGGGGSGVLAAVASFFRPNGGGGGSAPVASPPLHSQPSSGSPLTRWTSRLRRSSSSGGLVEAYGVSGGGGGGIGRRWSNSGRRRLSSVGTAAAGLGRVSAGGRRVSGSGGGSGGGFFNRRLSSTGMPGSLGSLTAGIGPSLGSPNIPGTPTPRAVPTTPVSAVATPASGAGGLFARKWQWRLYPWRSEPFAGGSPLGQGLGTGSNAVSSAVELSDLAAVDADAGVSIVRVRMGGGGGVGGAQPCGVRASHCRSDSGDGGSAEVAAPPPTAELRQLLTQGTSGAPDTAEWWAAAASGARQLLQLHGSSGLDGAAGASGSGPALILQLAGPSVGCSFGGQMASGAGEAPLGAQFGYGAYPDHSMMRPLWRHCSAPWASAYGTAAAGDARVSDGAAVAAAAASSDPMYHAALAAAGLLAIEDVRGPVAAGQRIPVPEEAADGGVQGASFMSAPASVLPPLPSVPSLSAAEAGGDYRPRGSISLGGGVPPECATTAEASDGGGGGMASSRCPLTAASPFAAVSAMSGLGWDGTFLTAIADPWAAQPAGPHVAPSTHPLMTDTSPAAAHATPGNAAPAALPSTCSQQPPSADGVSATALFEPPSFPQPRPVQQSSPQAPQPTLTSPSSQPGYVSAAAPANAASSLLLTNHHSLPSTPHPAHCTGPTSSPPLHPHAATAISPSASDVPGSGSTEHTTLQLSAVGWGPPPPPPPLWPPPFAALPPLPPLPPVTDRHTAAPSALPPTASSTSALPACEVMASGTSRASTPSIPVPAATNAAVAPPMAAAAVAAAAAAMPGGSVWASRWRLPSFLMGPTCHLPRPVSEGSMATAAGAAAPSMPGASSCKSPVADSDAEDGHDGGDLFGDEVALLGAGGGRSLSGPGGAGPRGRHRRSASASASPLILSPLPPAALGGRVVSSFLGPISAWAGRRQGGWHGSGARVAADGGGGGEAGLYGTAGLWAGRVWGDPERARLLGPRPRALSSSGVDVIEEEASGAECEQLQEQEQQQQQEQEAQLHRVSSLGGGGRWWQRRAAGASSSSRRPSSSSGSGLLPHADSGGSWPQLPLPLPHVHELPGAGKSGLLAAAGCGAVCNAGSPRFGPGPAALPSPCAADLSFDCTGNWPYTNPRAPVAGPYASPFTAAATTYGSCSGYGSGTGGNVFAVGQRGNACGDGGGYGDNSGGGGSISVGDGSMGGGAGGGGRNALPRAGAGGVSGAAWWRRGPSLALLLLGPSDINFWGTVVGLPWGAAMHLLAMFVLVECLEVHGWLDALAALLDQLAASGDSLRPAAHDLIHPDTHVATFPFLPPPPAAAGTIASASAAAAAVFLTGCLSVLVSVAMTGQFAAVLLARAMLRPGFLVGVAAEPAVRRGAHLALIIAVNFAPGLALTGSLTALRWGLGLRDLGVKMRFCRNVVSGLVPAMAVGLLVALLVLWLECLLWV